MGKAPSFPWYPNDFDRDLGKCTTNTAGIWARCLNQMWYEKIRGQLSMPRKSYLILCRCFDDEFQQFLDENVLFGFANITQENGIITVINRRMYREEKERTQARIRAERYRNKEAVTEKPRNNNADVTLPSSSSSSSSNLNTTSQKELSDQVQKVFGYWKTKDNLIRHRSIGDKHKRHIKARLADFTVEEICESIDNYSKMLADYRYKMDYRWTIDQFMVRGLEKFLSENQPFQSYPRTEGAPPPKSNIPTDDLGRPCLRIGNEWIEVKEFEKLRRSGEIVRKGDKWVRKEA